MQEQKTELQRNALATARRQELEVFQRALDVQWLNSRMESGRMGRCLALIQQEAQMEKEFQERTDHAAIVNARAEKETALGVEIAKARREEICKLARRHYLRQRDPSLRILEQKLQAGYVCRDLQQQILHNQYKKLQEEAEAKQADDYLQKALYNDFEAKEKEDREKMEHTTQYCKELQQQLVNRQLAKQCQYEESLIEKKMLEEIMRTLADEDHRELAQKRKLTEKMRNEMVTFQKARAAWKDKQKNVVIAEERQIEEQLKMMGDRSVAIVQERERKLKLKEEINEKVAAKIMAEEAARLERINLIKLLQEQESLEKNVQDDIAEREKQERVRRDTMDALTAQMDTKKRLAREQREKEAVFRKESEAKMAADLAKERDKERKKREQGRLYSQALLEQIAANRARRERDGALEQRRAAHVWDCDRRWREEVAAEREKMVEQHAAPLLGHLQAGALQEGDLPAVRRGAAATPRLAPLHIGGLAAPSSPRRREEVAAEREKMVEQHAAPLLGHLQAGALQEGDLPAVRRGAAATPRLAPLHIGGLAAPSSPRRREEVAAEREKMVEQHAAPLLGHLQAGALQEGDLPAVRRGAAATPRLAPLHIGGLAAPSSPRRREEVAAEREKMVEQHAAPLLGHLQAGALQEGDLPAVRRGAAATPRLAPLHIGGLAAPSSPRRREEVAAEREKMVEQHAAPLLGHLQAGALQEGDLPAVRRGAAATPRLAPLHIGGLAAPSSPRRREEVAAEREKMVEQHAAPLLGHLQAGALQEGDLPAVRRGAAATPRLAPLHIGGLAAPSSPRRREEVAAEREKMVEQHAAPLLGHLQAGALQEGDLPAVRRGAAATPRLAPLHIGGLAAPSSPRRREEVAAEREKMVEQHAAPLLGHLQAGALQEGDLPAVRRGAAATPRLAPLHIGGLAAPSSPRRREEVAAEREKMVEQHAAPLLGHLQAGALQEGDLPAVRRGAAATPRLAPLHIGGLAAPSSPRRYSKCNAQCRILREY